MRREAKAAIDEAVEERLLAALVGDVPGADTKSAFRTLYRCVWVCGCASGVGPR